MKKTSIVLFILSIILLFTAIWGNTKKTLGENIITRETVLLNPKYAPLVNKISLKSSMDELVLYFEQNRWFASYKELVFPVSASKINELINLSSTTLSAQVINNTSNNSNPTTFLDNIILSFADSDSNKVYSSIKFGSTDFTGTKRYVQSTQKETLFLINDLFYGFLQTNPKAWLDSKLIPSFLLDNQQIVSISLKSIDTEILHSNADSNFSSLANEILNLQSSNIVSATEYEKKSPLHEIILSFSNGDSEIIEVHSVGTSYVIIPQNEQVFYGLEISQWTYEKLITAFQI